MAKDTLVEINVERLRYLLKLYSLSEVELLSILNEDGHKRAFPSYRFVRLNSLKIS